MFSVVVPELKVPTFKIFLWFPLSTAGAAAVNPNPSVTNIEKYVPEKTPHLDTFHATIHSRAMTWVHSPSMVSILSLITQEVYQEICPIVLFWIVESSIILN